MLQKIFAEEVEKIDDGFFRRMKESRYWPEDKRDRQGKCPELPYALFADDDYTDKEYHKQFPTIYHLRKWLMETDETPDISCSASYDETQRPFSIKRKYRTGKRISDNI